MKVTIAGDGIKELFPMVRTGDPYKHISMIIRYLCLKLGHFEDDGQGPAITRMELGSAFEEAVQEGLARRYVLDDPHRYVRPGELELDDLIGTPDLLDLTLKAVVEIKLTWMSTRQGDDPNSEKFWKYWTQLKAYCKMMEWTVGYLHVGFVNGNYRDDRLPRYTIWRAEFTQSEINENWAMLVSNGKKMRQERALAGLT